MVLSSTPTQYNFKPLGTIIKVSPDNVNEVLKTIAVQSIEAYEAEKDVSSVVTYVVSMLDTVLKPYLQSLLGQIVDPRFAREVFVDRILQFANIILSIVKERISSAFDEIISEKFDEKEVARRIRDIENLYSVAFVIVNEVANRLFTLLQINSPAIIRPPLANTLIGYDIIMSRG
jgi:hypothetical protein